ncbi:tetraacyldisaccharide 4'-kinase [bacterium]|nr:tetraacyldisaccharide 4'-kinase [bacterium]
MKLFISKIHYEKNPNLLQKILVYFLSIFEIFYRIAVAVRNFCYDKKILKTSNFKNVIVISTGNLTTGGVGKTPFTAELANYYTKNYKKVAVISRGYGGTLENKEVNVISDGQKINFSAKESGDEPFWLATNCPSVVILTCSSRVKAARMAVDKYNCNIIIADDAFQHRKLDRNSNLLLVDSKNKFGNNHLLPAGPLRESFKEVKRATAIVVTNKSLDDEDALKYCDEIKERFHKPVFLCKMIPERAFNIYTNESLYQGASVLAFCAIGQPKEFFNFVQEDYYMQSIVEFPDHHSYSYQDVERLIKIAEQNNLNFLITTEKDAVKIKDIFSNFKTTIKVYALKLRAFADIEDIVNAR